MAELFIIGQISEISGIKLDAGQGIFCKWSLQLGNWSKIR